MAKWIYERWSLKWDPTAFTESGSGMYNLSDTINIVTLEVEERSPFAGEAALASSSVSEYISGRLTQIHLYQGISGGKHHFMMDTYTRDQLSTHRIKGDRMPDIVLEEGTVPDDGIHTDGYWYIKVKPAFPTMRILRDGQWAEVETGYVLKDGVWKPIEEIYKLQDGQWVQA